MRFVKSTVDRIQALSPALSLPPSPPSQKVYVAVGIDDERPELPPDGELPGGAPVGPALEAYKALMRVITGGGV